MLDRVCGDIEVAPDCIWDVGDSESGAVLILGNWYFTVTPSYKQFIGGLLARSNLGET